MIQGEVNSDRQVMISLQVYDSSGRPVALEAQIDTGFSDCLTLSPARIATLQLVIWGRSSFILGDGHEEEFNLYSSKVLFNEKEHDIFILEADSEPPLVGMTLLYGSHIQLDVIEGGAVLIDSIP